MFVFLLFLLLLLLLFFWVVFVVVVAPAFVNITCCHEMVSLHQPVHAEFEQVEAFVSSCGMFMYPCIFLKYFFY